jgi:hypothetical protein
MYQLDTCSVQTRTTSYISEFWARADLPACTLLHTHAVASSSTLSCSADWLRTFVCPEIAVKAFDLGPQAWDGWVDIDGPPPPGAELCYGDIVDFETVRAA